MISRPKYFVAYADILGFRNLVMRHRAPRAGSLDHKLRAGWWHHDAINDMYTGISDLVVVPYPAEQASRLDVPGR